MITDDTMLVTLTVGQLRETITGIVGEALAKTSPTPAQKPEDLYEELVWGQKALAEYLGVTPATCSKYIREERYGDAIVKEKGSRKVGFYPKLLNQKIRELCSS